jgi:hypothetical protein
MGTPEAGKGSMTAKRGTTQSFVGLHTVNRSVQVLHRSLACAFQHVERFKIRFEIGVTIRVGF